MEGGVTSLDSRRFWAKVDIRHSSECWVWKAKAKTTYGYGVFRISREAGVIGAHRAAYMLARSKDLSPGHYVMHTCDNPACCNPSHLREATPAENSHDMLDKGRNRYVSHPGAKNGRAKLTEADVRAIRGSALSTRQAAEAWGLSQVQIQKIVSRRAWREVA